MRLPVFSLLVIGLTGSLGAEATLPQKNPTTWTPRQWTQAFAVAAELPLASRIGLWADLMAIDSTYVADPLGEGAGNGPDADPLCDFARVDCVTFVEHVFALALATTRNEAQSVLNRLRYRDGQIAYRWRNHYFVADWLAANAWLVPDCTASLATAPLMTMTKSIARGAFFAQKGLLQFAQEPTQELSIAYLPRARTAELLPRVRTGDLLVLLVDRPDLDAGHVGLIRVVGASVQLQHASLTAKAVVTVPLLPYIQDLPPRFVGLLIFRPRAPSKA